MSVGFAGFLLWGNWRKLNLRNIYVTFVLVVLVWIGLTLWDSNQYDKV